MPRSVPTPCAFPGSGFYNDRAVFSGNSGGETAVVGSKPAGASWLGVHDLVGNAYEWVSDWHGELYYSSLEPGAVNPQGLQEGTERVLRGGSWIGVELACYTAIRFKQTPDTHGGHIGFAAPALSNSNEYPLQCLIGQEISFLQTVLRSLKVGDLVADVLEYVSERRRQRR